MQAAQTKLFLKTNTLAISNLKTKTSILYTKN